MMTSIKTESIHEFNYPRSTSPPKESVRSNAHPYAIKTTSIALLSRSNSSSRIHDSSHYHYVPRIPPATSLDHRKHEGAHYRHRYSSKAVNDSSGKHPRTFYNPVVFPGPLTLENLPPNPKLWTPSQLCAYLSTALRVKSGESLQLPAPVARDIASFVRESKITGRIFLRLDEKDLEAYGVNKLWKNALVKTKNALVKTSQILRQNDLKDQIWGFVEEPEETSNGINFSSSSFNHSFPNGLPVYSSASSSSSSNDLFSPTGISPSVSFTTRSTSPNGHSHYIHDNRSRHGTVKGMVDSFERSSSFDEGDPTSAKLLQEIKGNRELDLEKLRKISRERSGSTSSISNGSSGSSHSPTSSSDDDSEPSAFVGSPVEEYNVSTITSSRPLPNPPRNEIDDVLFVSGLEEPSIEELLAPEGRLEDTISSHSSLATLNSTFKNQTPSFAKSTFSISKGKGRAKKRGGVYAWEEEVQDLGAAAPGKTAAKRVFSQIPIPAAMMSSASSAKDIFEALENVDGNIREDQLRSVDTSSPALVKSGQGSGSHTPSRPLPEIPLHPSLVALPEPGDISFSPVSPKETDEETRSHASIAEITGLLQAFEVRLADVERKVDVLDVELKELEVANLVWNRQQAEHAVQIKDETEQTTREDKVEEVNEPLFLSEWPINRKVINRVFRSSPAGQPPSIVSRIFHSQYWRSASHINPQTLSQLPPYVLLVGLGICAVVLRVIARRLTGKR
ncbi:uncharacterized protein C8R40DRAFT_1095744 [Lentinula edodes]|uniref:uncharacterized protein n=1 Tax=Lentinula edodes TaxID=5353 RepID=UPI001E8ED85D|nr:uncharacterized protein C8R40DRAFT_1095744 [Lentinula edodes]KAH7877357.1 hypothetical protein C8R40DRAFT_1095744 [Lentinula edodes]